MICKEGKDSFREGTTQEEMLGIIFSPTAKNTPARALFATMLELFLGQNPIPDSQPDETNDFFWNINIPE